jgi:hypothetical protein
VSSFENEASEAIEPLLKGPHRIIRCGALSIRDSQPLASGCREGLQTEAGYRVGYDDASHFSREYKRHFGEPPMRDVERLREWAGAPAGAPARERITVA